MILINNEGREIQNLVVEDGKNTYLLLENPERSGFYAVFNRRKYADVVCLLQEIGGTNKTFEIPGNWEKLLSRIDGTIDDLYNLVSYPCTILIKT